jgi:hypothetical protein
MPSVLVIIAMMVAIPVAFARLGDAAQEKPDETQQETAFGNAIRSRHGNSRVVDNANSLLRGGNNENPPIADNARVASSYKSAPLPTHPRRSFSGARKIGHGSCRRPITITVGRAGSGRIGGPDETPSDFLARSLVAGRDILNSLQLKCD